MQQIVFPENDKVLVGLKGNDDAGVLLLNDETALIQTVDFITPLVDDPFTFGMIAACNSLSDVYAMGGTPITALNIVCFPSDNFGLDVLRDILKGGLEICNQASCQILGGHSINDRDLKYGLSVTGTVCPGSVIRNRGVRDGDRLILTKPLGTGIIATAFKADMAEGASTDHFIRSMTRLNRSAGDIIKRYPVHACTDVTGFGLGGHLKEMLGDDQLEATINSRDLPALAGALKYAGLGLVPAGRYRNEDFASAIFIKDGSVTRELYDLFFDPQTSGGLLAAMGRDDAEKAIDELHRAGDQEARIIGEVKKGKTAGILLA